jgi:ligand-binding sensor domain-containing protein/DNA-binding CsgD family transcriptional regulator
MVIPAERVTADAGLFNDFVYSVFQDRSGFIWLGGSLGVARHDGVHFRVFRRANTLPRPLSSDYVLSIAQDPSGDLWLGTIGGLNRMEIASESFTAYRHDPRDPRSIPGDFISHLCVSKSRPGLLWVSTKNGLGLFDTKTGQCQRFRADPSRPGSLASDQVRMVIEDSRQRVWVATDGGLQRFLPASASFESFRHDPVNGNSLGSEGVFEIFESPRQPGILWMGGAGNSLSRFDPDRNSWRRYSPPDTYPAAPRANAIFYITDYPDDPNALLLGTQNGLYWFNHAQDSWRRIVLQDQFGERGDPRDEMILSVFHDRSGMCWVCVDNRGLFKCLPQPDLFRRHLNRNAGVDSVAANRVLGLCEDDPGRIWLATAAGAFRYTPESGTYERFPLATGRTDMAGFNRVYRIHRTRRGEIWASTVGGLVRFDPRSGEEEVFAARADDPATLGFTAVAMIRDDSRGDVWIASDFCLLRWDSRARAFKRYLHDANDPGSLSASHANPVMEDREGNVWIGTENGLNLYDRDRDRFTRYYLDPPDPSRETQNYVMILHQDLRGRIWVATSNGLNRMERSQAGVRFQHFSAPGSTLCNFIMGIVEDDEENLWISSAAGLSRFNMQSGTFSEYDSRDRVPAGALTYGSYLRLKSGDIYFGGLKGMFSFKPWLARINRYAPPLAFTDFQVWRRPVAIGGDSPLPRSIVLAPDLVLSHRQNSLGFSFAALSYVRPDKNQYAYRLDGRDDSWHDLGFEHSVNLDNLRPGRYRLRVRGSNNEGLWNEEGITLAIRIRPPWWHTWWFRVLSLLVVAAVVVQLNRTRARRLAARIRNETALENYFDKFGISTREREIIHLLLRGKSNHEIEDALFISVSTVKIHVYHIFQKLNVKNRAQLIALFKNLQVK